MSVSDWLSLAFVCILGAASPGRASQSSCPPPRPRAGWRAGSGIGHGLAFSYAFVAATSLFLIITHHATLFVTLQLAGAVLLVWLWRLFLARFAQKTSATRRKRHDRQFSSGFAIATFNPKIAAFFASLFSQFFAEGQRSACISAWPHSQG